MSLDTSPFQIIILSDTFHPRRVKDDGTTCCAKLLAILGLLIDISALFLVFIAPSFGGASEDGKEEEFTWTTES